MGPSEPEVVKGDRVKDEIVDEIRRHRDQHAASFDYDIERIVEDLQRREKESGVTPVARSPRRPER